jgi:hypothetical protein
MFIRSQSGDLVSFTDYILSESILPKKTSYGTDTETKNSAIGIHKNLLWTVTKHDDNYYMVLVNKNTGECGFGVYDKWDGDFDLPFSHERKMSSNALTSFGYVWYILLEIADKHSLSQIKFDAADPKLGRVYDRMIQNKLFLSYLSNSGWTYKDKTNNFYYFIRK